MYAICSRPCCISWIHVHLAAFRLLRWWFLECPSIFCWYESLPHRSASESNRTEQVDHINDCCDVGGVNTHWQETFNDPIIIYLFQCIDIRLHHFHMNFTWRFHWTVRDLFIITRNRFGLRMHTQIKTKSIIWISLKRWYKWIELNPAIRTKSIKCDASN